MWLFVPLLLTQGYLFGLYVDYNRFLYFLVMPVLILFAMMIDHGSGYLAKISDSTRNLIGDLQKLRNRQNKWASKISAVLTRKRFYTIFLFLFLIILLFNFPLFLTPSTEQQMQSFYQIMNQPLYQAIQWANKNTPPGSVFVSDAEYGWWIGGFADRPTLSAVSP